MNNNYKPVLAMYDIRAKQEFIFRTNTLKEIAGASALIRDCYKDYLYPAAEACTSAKGLFVCEEGELFGEKTFYEHLDAGYIGEVIYEGGGNFQVLFKDEEAFKEVTYEFTKRVLEDIGTLNVLATCVDAHLEDYKKDEAALRAAHSKNESELSTIAPWGTVPMAQVDTKTSMPLVAKINGNKVSKESYAKRRKYMEELNRRTDIGETELDKLVTEKGVDSHIAIIYADGNDMGKKVTECKRQGTSYEECIKLLREFSADIQKKYVDDRIRDFDKALEAKYGEKSKRRLVLGAGDEINIICNAADAFELAQTYIEGISAEEGCSSCIGIALFHSHAPYAEAYRIAEECCESGKVQRRLHANDPKWADVCMLDFHYIQGGIGASLEEIRKHEGTIESSRPWIMSGEKLDASMTSADEVASIRKYLKAIGHSNVKGLLGVAKTDLYSLKMEMDRIRAHMGKSAKESNKDILSFAADLNDKKRRLIYDMVIVYDLWFRGGDK